MDAAVLGSILASVAVAATPLLLAALGELVVEKSGVLNLGVEGMMLTGAVAGFGVTLMTGSGLLGILAAMAAAVAVSLIFGVLTLRFQANQVASGLALTIFGIGLSSLAGQGLVGNTVTPLPKLDIPALSTLPVIGPALFAHDGLVYASVILTVAVGWFLTRSRPGLILRACGEDPAAAHALGYPVIGIRTLAVMFGGAMAGLSGAFLSLSYTPLWAENMSAGRGWIALALVVFATWRPGRLLLGAYIFGGITIAQLHGQGFGLAIPSQFLSMLPYLATIIVLVLISRDRTLIRLNAPASLGKSFHPEA